MTVKLLGCPFCGGQAAFSGSEGRGYRVQCCGCGIEGGWGDYGYQAASAWNTRVRPPSHDPALLEALEGAQWQLQCLANIATGHDALKHLEPAIREGVAKARAAISAAKGASHE